MKKLHTRQNWGLFLLRFGIGVVFIVHGYTKLTDITGTAGFFESQAGLPMPMVLAVLVTAVELLGGIALIIGFYTRVAASLIAVIMVVAIITVKGAKGFLGNAELDFIIFFSSMALVLIGPGDLRLRFSALGTTDKTEKNHSEKEMSGYQHQV